MKKTFQMFWSRNDYLPYVALLFLIIVLRLPNFFEPYWYTDESTYLLVGNELKHGAKLYIDIVENRPPLTLIVAMLPNLSSLKVILFIWTAFSGYIFFQFCKVIFAEIKYRFLSTALFIALTSVPAYNGNIFNTELLFNGFILSAGYMLLKSSALTAFFHSRNSKSDSSYVYSFFGGLFFGFGILTKVPAILSVLSFVSIYLYVIWNSYGKKNNSSNQVESIKRIYLELGFVMLGTLLPVLVSILYFWSQGSLKEYYYWVITYVIHYTNNTLMHVQFSHNIIKTLFSFEARNIVLIVLLVLIFTSKKLSNKIIFLLLWFIFTLYGALITLRPYPHYFLQVFPPLALIITLLIKHISTLRFTRESFVLLLAVIFFISIQFAYSIRLFPTIGYYNNFLQFVSHNKTKREYYRFFDPQVNESMNPNVPEIIYSNYEAASFINSLGVKSMYIWGMDPMLWAQTKLRVVSPIPLYFYIVDLGLYDEVLRDVENKKADLIVVIIDQKNSFPRLNAYIDNKYRLMRQYPTMSIYRRI